MKSIEEKYKKLSQREHILHRPDTYIGSIQNYESIEYVLQNGVFTKRNVKTNDGLLKIFDEIISNAVDHVFRKQQVTKIKVTIDKSTGEISVYNDGKGIPVVIHKEHNIYVPELIFSHFLTGSNYDDNEERNGVGRNGVGSKAVSVFSKEFKVETVDENEGKKFTQTFKNNMEEIKKPKITSCNSKGYTKITFTPDYGRFGLDNLTDDLYLMMEKRVYDCVASTSVSIYFNNIKIKANSFKDYISFYSKSEPIAYEKASNGWEYAVFESQESYEQVSFVNGNNTTKGGKHVDYLTNQITNGVKALVKGVNVGNRIKDSLFIILKADIINPSFSSQTKDTLTSTIKKFTVSDKFIKKIYGSNITKKAIEITNFKEMKKLDVGVSSSKKSKVKVAKLDDAYNAGTSKSSKCSLILTEGDSAKTFAVAGLSVIGRENYGIYCLKGKALNVREATQQQLLKNEEIINLKQIMGLHTGKKYIDTRLLRYSSIILLTDQDHDGAHISGLVMNFIHYWWPELMEIPGFIKTIKTPLIKVSKGNQIKEFYNEFDYKQWITEVEDISKWNAKYYKGLGTSTSKESKEIFKNIKNNTRYYISQSEKITDEAIKLAFDKSKASDRKEWLKNVPEDYAIANSDNEITYDAFVNKELVHFSNYDNVRSIPCMVDGLKPSQRKVLYTAFKRNITKDIKVAQFGASVAENTAYHHGEASLYGTIIGMAQNYTGAGNINLLEPVGMFGSRLNLGKDFASPRYIFTKLSQDAIKLFNPTDNNILDYNEDDGNKIEPKFYTPSIPMVLVNGAIGIGTGYSTNIPHFKPDDIVKNILLYLQNKRMETLVPWYRGFKGTIIKQDDTCYIQKGCLDKINDLTLQINEIPTNIGIQSYLEFLEKNEDFETVNMSTEEEPKFILKFNSKDILKKYDYSLLKLTSKINLTNMYLFDEKGVLKKYTDPNDIIRDFIKVKLDYLERRKDYLECKLKEELVILENKKRFLEEIMDGKVNVYRVKKTKAIEDLKSRNYTHIDQLLNIPVSSFTEDAIVSLQNKIENSRKEYDVIKNKSAKQLLLDDL